MTKTTTNFDADLSTLDLSGLDAALAEAERERAAARVARSQQAQELVKRAGLALMQGRHEALLDEEDAS